MSEPLTPEEERVLREAFDAGWADYLRGGTATGVFAREDIQRLLATLDAERQKRTWEEVRDAVLDAARTPSQPDRRPFIESLLSSSAPETWNEAIRAALRVLDGEDALANQGRGSTPSQPDPEYDADGAPIRPDPHSDDWYDGYAEANREWEQRTGITGSTPSQPDLRLDVERLRQAIELHAATHSVHSRSHVRPTSRCAEGVADAYAALASSQPADPHAKVITENDLLAAMRAQANDRAMGMPHPFSEREVADLWFRLTPQPAKSLNEPREADEA